MFREVFLEVFLNKWILGGYVFAILFGIGCYFWYQHQLAPDKRDSAETTEADREWETPQKANTNNTPADNTDLTAEKSITETSPDGVENPASNETHANLTEKTQETENTEEVPVSPHGFGPFPEVPEDYMIKPFSWDFYTISN